MKYQSRRKSVLPVVIVTALGFCIAVWAGGCTSDRSGKYKNSVRGSAMGADCKSKDASFKRCMKRSGPTGLKGCQSEFASRERACKGTR